MKEMPEEQCEVNVMVLNSLLYLFSISYKTNEIEAKILPEYAMNKIDYDENTYAILAKQYLEMRDLDKVYDMFL